MLLRIVGIVSRLIVEVQYFLCFLASELAPPWVVRFTTGWGIAIKCYPHPVRLGLVAYPTFDDVVSGYATNYVAPRDD